MSTLREFGGLVADDGQVNQGGLAVQSDSDLPVGVQVDRREYPRQDLQLRTCLMPLRGTDDISCLTDDVSTTGMHVTVPVGYGMAVGQRFEMLVAAPGASVGLGPLLIGPGRFATVVRTRLQAGNGEGWVGVGLRFDQPAMLP